MHAQQSPSKAPPVAGPSGPSVGAVALLAVGHIVAYGAWYDDVGALSGIFALPLMTWAAVVFGYRGAVLGFAWAVLANLLLTVALKPAGISLMEAWWIPPNYLGHPAGLLVSLVIARQRQLAEQLEQQIHALRHTEALLREAERKQTQARMNDRLHRADRMASVGTLAAGVAHEINNPLTYVIGNLYYALERIEEDDPSRSISMREELRELLHDATDGAERVRRIVRDLKTFSRSGDDDDENRIDVKRAIQAATNLVRNEIRHRAALEVEIHDLPLVAGNESRLVQVLVNLLMNASQAIPEGNAEAEFIRVRATLSASGRVVIEISDSGGGMPADVQARVFDPFFTTKPVGEGTGLGLSVTHGIVASMGGDIAVRSAPGEGSTFTVTLPVEAAERRNRSLTPPPLVQASPTEGPIRRALVIDDEPKVAASVARLLEGFDVVTITDGRDALERLRRDQQFDVVLCDLMMPHVTGMELFERARAMEPELAPRFVFMTGGAFTPKARAFISDVNNICIEKPFDARQLEDALQQVLAPEHSPEAPAERPSL